MKHIKSIILTMLTALLALPASAQTIVGLATLEDLDAVGLTGSREELPGGTKILENEAATFSLAYDDSWGRTTCYSKYRNVYVGSSSEIELGYGAVGTANPTFVSYQSGVMTAGAVFEIDAKMDGWITVFTKLNPNKQYVVFEGKDSPLAYTLGVAGADYSINYTLPSDKDGYIDFTSLYASRYFIPATRQSTNASGIPLWSVDGEVIASSSKPEGGTAVMEEIPGETKPQFPWIVAGLEEAPGEGTGFLTFKVRAGKTYYFSALGSKMVCGGFVFTGSAEEPAVSFAATDELPEVEFKASLSSGEGTSPGNPPIDPFDPSIASGNSTIVLANAETLESVGLSSTKIDMPGGTMILDSQVGSFGLTYDDAWGILMDYRTYRGVRVGNSEEIQLERGVVGNTNPTFVSYQSGVMSAGAVFEIEAKKDGWMTVFTRLNPNKQYVVFEGKTQPLAYTLGVAGAGYLINYTLPSDENGFINFDYPDASRYFTTATKQAYNESGVPLWEVDGKVVASYARPDGSTAVKEEVPGETKPQFPWIVAGLDQSPDIGTGFLTFKVRAGKTYYLSALGSKMVCGGFVFTDSASEPAVTFAAIEDLPEIKFETGLPAAPAVAAGDDFEYEGVWYTVIDPDAKTCKTKDGHIDSENKTTAGNNCQGNIVIPEKVSDVLNDYTVIGIGRYGFSGCTRLASVEIPGSVTSIGEYAFSECINLTSVNIPDAVVSIGNSAFRACASLPTINLPSSLTSIGEMTFTLCKSLSSIDLPETLTSIGDMAFAGCSALSSIVIPNTVSTIGIQTFGNCTSLTSVELPEALKSISDALFMGCSSLTSIEVPASVTSIGRSAFEGCTVMAIIKIPESVTSIGQRAFWECKGLSSVTIPTSLTTIAPQTFYGCSSLTSMDIPESVTSIGEAAFMECSGFESVTIPGSVASIGERAFYYCNNIASVTYSASSPVAANEDIFHDNVYTDATLNTPNATLASVQATAPWNLFKHIVASDGSAGFVAAGDDFEYEGLWYTVIDIETKTCKTKVGNYENSIVTPGNDVEGEVVIPAKVSFGGNEYSVVEIGDFGFHGTRITMLELPETLRTIGSYSFEACDSLTEVVFPRGLEIIKRYAFQDCAKLSQVNLQEGVTAVEAGAFQSCSSLSSLSLPASLKEVGFGTFSFCALTSVEIPENMEIVAESSFSENPIKSVSFPSSLKEIRKQAFYQCELTSVEIPENVEVIGLGCFDLNPLKSVILPASLKQLDYAAFGECDSISSVVYNASTPITSYDNVFSETAYKKAILTTPNATLGDIQATVPWNKFVHIQASDGSVGFVAAGDDFEYEGVWYTVIDPEAKTCMTKGQVYDEASGHYVAGNNCSGDLVIPETASDGQEEYKVIEIGIRSFKGNELTSVTVPETITVIPTSAFEECGSLTTVHLPETITLIEGTAFQSCTNLSSINWPSSLKNIEGGAFNYCHFTSINLPEGLEEIGQWAFQGNPLSSVSLPASLIKAESAPFNACYGISEVNYAAEIPVAMVENLFTETVYANATLHTPNAALEAVQSTTPWNLFKYIVANDGSAGFVADGDEFEYEGIWYTVIDPEAKTAKTKDNGNVGMGNLVIPALASDGNEQYSVVEIGEGGFAGSSELLSITLPATIGSIGNNAFADCERLTSLVWRSHSRLDRKVVSDIANPNLLVYVDSLQFAPQGMSENVVADGRCNSLDLTPGYPFTPVAAFTALSSRMVKSFTQETPINGCEGWETIVLPFDVESVYAENLGSELTPFGLITDIYEQRPYWLYEADPRGEWKHAFGIQAGVPYIISTPNNVAYPEYYNVDGPVVFSSDKAQRIAPATTAPYAVTWASGREFRSLWLPLSEAEAADAMGLNVGMNDLRGEDGEYLAPGSAFHVDVRPKPLEAYVTRLGAERAMKIIGNQSAVIPVVADSGLDIRVEDGVIYALSSNDRKVYIYTPEGAIVRVLDLKANEPMTVDDLTEGIYIIAGRKLILH